METKLKDKRTPTELLMDSLAGCDRASGAIIILDSEGDGIYELRSNLTTQTIIGLFELAKHHMIERMDREESKRDQE